jgi:hypothetical protein
MDVDRDDRELITDDPRLPRGTVVRVAGEPRVAWSVRHVVDDRVACRMVGDDRTVLFEREELEPLEREAYCGACGQIGCAHDGYDREEAW